MEDAAVDTSGRFEMRGQLGEGGMGVVYRVFDRQRGREVALKALRGSDGRDLLRFKREFRALADLVHPNLVALHELTRVGGEWMITMELIDGVTFLEWVRTPARDDARLRDALGQLTDGLIALHDAGKLHRDLKPSNVLVEDAGGRVVILDFGLVAEQERVDATHEALAVGTPAFMSPEQAGDLPLTPATDWYAVGVMLYEALCGRRPFEGTAAQVLGRKRTKDAPAPSTHDPSVPRDLEALCMRLLDRDPAARSGGAEILAALGRERSEATRRVERQATRPPFVGRGAELARLRDALEASRTGGVIVVVRGASGMGKSTLVRAFLDGLGEAATVLEGRCYEREAVPYKAVDGVVDDLAQALMAWPRPDRVEVRDLAALGRLFPVLRRVPWMQVPALPGTLPSDPAELRRRAFGALRAIVAALAAHGPLVIAIDDLQWGDVDGAAALAELVGGDGPGPLVIATHRSEEQGEALTTLRRRAAAPIHELALGALPEDEARVLWASLGGEAADDGAVRDAAGSPLFLGEIAAARASGTRSVASVDAAVHARVARLGPDAHAILEALSVAGRPMRVAMAPRAAGVEVEAVDAALAELRAERLVRVRGGDPVVEAKHDRIRAAVIGAMSAETRRDVHARLAAALAADDPDDFERMLEHWLGAGDGDRACREAERAAARAEERLAFHRAAELLGLALLRAELDDVHRRELLTRRGRALASAGRLVEAAVELRGAGALASGRERFALERLAIENLLKAGQLERGLAAAEALLRELGETLPRRPTLGFVVERARLRLRGLEFVERPEAEIDPHVLDRLDALWSLANGLSFVEPILGVVLHTRLLREALAAGEPRRVAMAIGQELGYVAIGGSAVTARIDRLRARGSAIAQRLGHGDVLGFIEAGSGVGAYLAGRFREGLDAIDAGATRMRAHDGPSEMRWQLDLMSIIRLAALWWLGDLRRLARDHAAQLRAAIDDGNVNAQRHESSWPGSVVWLIAGDPAESRARIDAATPTIRGERFHLHHYHAAAGRTVVELYERRGAAAHARLEAVWRDVERAHVLRVQLVAIEAWYLRGCAAVAADRPALAATCAAQLDRHAVGHARALAAALRGITAAARGDAGGAASQLRAAIGHSETAEIAVHLAVQRQRLGTLLGDRALVDDAETWFRDHGVVDPDAFCAMLLPLR